MLHALVHEVHVNWLWVRGVVADGVAVSVVGAAGCKTTFFLFQFLLSEGLVGGCLGHYHCHGARMKARIDFILGDGMLCRLG